MTQLQAEAKLGTARRRRAVLKALLDLGADRPGGVTVPTRALADKAGYALFGTRFVLTELVRIGAICWVTAGGLSSVSMLDSRQPALDDEAEPEQTPDGQLATPAREVARIIAEIRAELETLAVKVRAEL